MQKKKKRAGHSEKTQTNKKERKKVKGTKTSLQNIHFSNVFLATLQVKI